MMVAQVGRHDGRYQWAAALLLYLAFSILLLGRGLAGHGIFYVGQDTDPPQTMWFFNWWRFSLARGLNPFVTDWVWAPLGVNLSWTAIVPLLAWASMPLQAAVGEPTTYNIMVILMPPLAAFAAYLLCRHVTGAFWPSVLGGYIFGFSPYMLGQLLAHLNLVAVFPVPLIVLLTLKSLGGELSERRFAILLAALLTAEFLCFPELFATVTLVGGFALLIALAVFDANARVRITRLIKPAIVGYSLATAALSPYLYYMLAGGFSHSSAWPADNFSADLLAFVVPTATNLFGRARLATQITSSFSGDIFEHDAYIGIPLIVFVELFRRRYWHTPAGKLLTVILLAVIVAAMGSSLHIAGKAGLPLPWALTKGLPLISIVLPVRMMMYAFLVLAIMAAIWFANSSTSRAAKIAAAALLVISIAPNPHASFWVSSLDIPAFFTDRTYATELEPREIILPLPWAQHGNSMYWQFRSDMYFRMAGGYTGVPPFEFDRMPVVNYFFGGIDLPEAGDQLKAYIARFGVQAIIADPTEENFDSFKRTLDSLGVAAQNEKGVWLYKIPHDSFAAYARLSGVQVEARANALRFDAILAGVGKYLADGHDLSKLSALELKRLDLLPHDWLVNPKFIAWGTGPAPGGRVAIAIFGSYDGVKPLIERYRAIASEIDYPAPTRWNKQSSPAEDRLGSLLIIFDRAQFEAATTQLKSSPPLEMMTPFLATDFRR
jgi:hypothetical protein